jgi:hypothetical protein
MMQPLLAALIVACCAAHAAWSLLLPAAMRRRIVLLLMRWHWPAAAARRLQAQAESAPGCHACDGCGRGVPAARPPAVQPMHWLQRRRD